MDIEITDYCNVGKYLISLSDSHNEKHNIETYYVMGWIINYYYPQVYKYLVMIL